MKEKVYLESLGHESRRVKRVRFETESPRVFEPEFAYSINQITVQEPSTP